MRAKTQKRLALAAWAALGFSTAAFGQISLTTGPYTQNFDSILVTVPADNTTQSSPPLPTGWVFSESGSNANTSYRVHNGGSSAGDTYLFGATGSAERALGGIASGSLLPTWGAQFVNGNGALAITSFSLAYTGEQWRDGGATAPAAQTTFFEYSLDATTITGGTWTSVTALNFTSPTFANTGGGVALNGNDPANQVVFAETLVASGLSIAPGQTFWIRWRDINDSGNDHGLAIDNVTLTFTTGPWVPPTYLTWDADTGAAGVQNGAGTWSASGNNWWNGTANVAWSGVDAVFGVAGSGTHTVTIGTGGVTAGNVKFTAGSPTYTLAGGDTLTINGGITADNSATISAPVNVGADQQWNVAASQTLTVSGAVSGGKIIKGGSGTLILSNTGNSHNGVQLDAGILELAADGNLGAAAAEFVSSGGTIKFTAPATFPGPGGGAGGRTFRLNAGTTVFDTNGNDITIAGDLVGGGNLVKTGAGVLTLASPSEPSPLNFSGGTIINGGTVRVNAEANNFCATGSGAVTINNGGAFHIDDIQVGVPWGSVSSRIFLNHGGTLLGTGPGANYSRGGDALTVQNGTVDSEVVVDIKTLNATDVFTFGNTVRTGTAPTGLDSSYNKIRVSGPGRVVLSSGGTTSTVAFRGSWEINGGILQVGPLLGSSLGEPLNALGFRTDGTNFVFTPATVNAGAMLAIGVDETNPNVGPPTNGLPPYIRNPITLNGGKIASTAFDVDQYGDPNVASPVHGALGGALTVQGGSILVYNPINSTLTGWDYQGPRNVNLVSDGDTSWSGNLTVDPGPLGVGGAFKINRTGGTVSVTAGASITVLAGASLQLDGTGVLSDGTNHVNIVNNSVSSLNVVTGNHAVGDVTGVGNTTVENTASLTANRIVQNALTLNGGNVNIRVNGGPSGVSAVNSLNIVGSGTLDLADNDITIDYSGPSPISSVVGWITSGYNGGAWTGTGIKSSQAASAGNTALGYGDDGNIITVKYTWYGDATLDGTVNFNDLLKLSQNYNGTGKDWSLGDFTYDGNVNFNDLLKLSQNYNKTGLSPAAGGDAAVPEPATVSLLVLASAGLLARRRRS